MTVWYVEMKQMLYIYR